MRLRLVAALLVGVLLYFVAGVVSAWFIAPGWDAVAWFLALGAAQLAVLVGLVVGIVGAIFVYQRMGRRRV